jgi:ATP-dependent DNA helicase PIF1
MGFHATLKLVCDMRAQSDSWFTDYLLHIGGGTEEVNSDGEVKLPDEICFLYTGKASDLDTLINSILLNLNENMLNKDYITSRAILSTTNHRVDKIDIKMIGTFQGGEMEYHSFDAAEDDPRNYYPAEFLNTLTPNDLPPHVLKLKVGCPVILLRNIDPTNGLCNGTSLVVRDFQKKYNCCRNYVRSACWERVFLPGYSYTCPTMRCSPSNLRK